MPIPFPSRLSTTTSRELVRYLSTERPICVHMSFIDVPISIVGATYSTKVDSLLPAFESIDIGATLPGLKTQLLDSGSLEGKLI